MYLTDTNIKQGKDSKGMGMLACLEDNNNQIKIHINGVRETVSKKGKPKENFYISPMHKNQLNLGFLFKVVKQKLL